jgi:sulfur-carrier protein adenylyltransferase/sulfurtransferase
VTANHSTPQAGGEAGDVPTIEPSELERRLQAGEDLELVDVRDRNEWDLGRIEGARLAPFPSFPAALASFDPAREVVVYCKTGIRSTKAARQLRDAGFRVAVLAGGIVRWADEIDPTVSHS